MAMDNSLMTDNPQNRLKKFTTVLILFFSFCFLSNTVKANNEHSWTPSKQKDGISSYTRKVNHSKYKAVRGETTLAVSTARLFAAINDAPACPEWADTCKESYIQQTLSKHEFYIYTLNDLPWPVKDRDVLAHVTWGQNKDGSIIMNSRAVKDKLEKKKGVVRIELATAQWHFTPLSNNSTLASFEIHMDPNGKIPSWLLNRLILNSPFTTFNSLAKQAAKDKYANAELPF